VFHCFALENFYISVIHSFLWFYNRFPNIIIYNLVIERFDRGICLASQIIHIDTNSITTFLNCFLIMRIICVSEAWSNGRITIHVVYRHVLSVRLISTLPFFARRYKSVLTRRLPILLSRWYISVMCLFVGLSNGRNVISGRMEVSRRKCFEQGRIGGRGMGLMGLMGLMGFMGGSPLSPRRPLSLFSP